MEVPAEPKIEQLSVDHQQLIDRFTCVETEDQLRKYKSSVRRKIKQRSREMDAFLKEEALKEQSLNLNTTHMFIDSDKNELMGFVSLCSDSIPLQLDERKTYQTNYQNVPALKIARLATNRDYQGNGVGKRLIQYSVYIALRMRENCGVKFLTLDCYEQRIKFYTQQGFLINLIQPEHKIPNDYPISMRLHVNDFLEKFDSELAGD